MPDIMQFDGGSEADRTQILAAHDGYLRANAAYDWQALKAIWGGDPTNGPGEIAACIQTTTCRCQSKHWTVDSRSQG